MRRFRGFATRLATSRGGVAALEFALVLPAFCMLAVMMIDFGYALTAKIRISNAITSAAHYAAVKGGSVPAGTAPGFVAEVEAVLHQGLRNIASPRVTVLFNGTADGSASERFLCPSLSPGGWTAAARSADCGGGVPAGRFVTIRVEAAHALLLPDIVSPARFLSMSGEAVARVE